MNIMKNDFEKFIKALEEIKAYCNKQEGRTACLKCQANKLCSKLFSEQPYKW